MNTADDIIKRLTQLSMARVDFERVWRQVADVAAPDVGDITFGGFNSPESLGIHRANAARRSKKIYDATAVWAVDRLASGLEGLIMPQSETWHTLQRDDIMGGAGTDEEVEWLEGLRDFMFKARYDASSGWQTAIQTALRRAVAFGNGYIYTEEGFGKALLRYRPLPLPEVYLAEDQFGEVDTFYRFYMLTARQAVQKFQGRVSANIQKAAESASDADRVFRFIQAVSPRADFGNPSKGIQRSPWASIHVEYDSRKIVGESGFFEFPLIDFRWLPEPGRTYGESPIMRCLSDIQSMQLMARNEMISSQQAADPPLLVARNGVVNRPNSNAGAIILGGLDANGKEMVKPLLTGQRIDLAQAVIQAKRTNLRESLYINLFALMVENPRMSATEALIRANEKGELLGPAGSRIQQSLSRLVEREIGILTRKGLFESDSAFRLPESLQGREVGVKFTSPLDRLRRAKDAEATIRNFEIMGPLIQQDPQIMDNYETDAIARGVPEVLGMPRKFIRRIEKVAEIRQLRAEQQAQAEQMAMAQAAASAAKDAAPAAETLMNMGGGQQAAA